MSTRAPAKKNPEENPEYAPCPLANRLNNNRFSSSLNPPGPVCPARQDTPSAIREHRRETKIGRKHRVETRPETPGGSASNRKLYPVGRKASAGVEPIFESLNSLGSPSSSRSGPDSIFLSFPRTWTTVPPFSSPPLQVETNAPLQAEHDASVDALLSASVRKLSTLCEVFAGRRSIDWCRAAPAGVKPLFTPEFVRAAAADCAELGKVARPEKDKLLDAEERKVPEIFLCFKQGTV